MKRIQHGPVRGISLKLQEEERERRMDFIPDQSALDKEIINVDSETLAMVKAMGFTEPAKLKKVDHNRKHQGRKNQKKN